MQVTEKAAFSVAFPVSNLVLATSAAHVPSVLNMLSQTYVSLQINQLLARVQDHQK